LQKEHEIYNGFGRGEIVYITGSLLQSRFGFVITVDIHVSLILYLANGSTFVLKYEVRTLYIPVRLDDLTQEVQHVLVQVWESTFVSDTESNAVGNREGCLLMAGKLLSAAQSIIRSQNIALDGQHDSAWSDNQGKEFLTDCGLEGARLKSKDDTQPNQNDD
jgi:tetrahydromethanopterin S-methyltransferase subunit B